MGALDDILPELESSLGPLSGSPAALEGGITNRNFRATFGGVEYVIRRAGKDTGLLGIDREAERLASEAAAGLGIAPAVALTLPEGLVTRFVDCSAVPPAELARRVGEIGAALRRFHGLDVALPSRFWVPELLGEYRRLVGERGGSLPRAYAEAEAVAARIAAVLPLLQAVPSHNDLLPGNLIRARDDGRILLVDWEYAGMGHPLFDLGNLAVNNDLDDDAEGRLLAAYYDAPPSDRGRASVKLMRLLSDAREGAWGVVQAGISELDFDFEGYGREHFERLLAAVAEPEFEEWLAAA
jgi:thiamine kinase-like enzyme